MCMCLPEVRTQDRHTFKRVARLPVMGTDCPPVFVTYSPPRAAVRGQEIICHPVRRSTIKIIKLDDREQKAGGVILKRCLIRGINKIKSLGAEIAPAFPWNVSSQCKNCALFVLDSNS